MATHQPSMPSGEEDRIEQATENLELAADRTVLACERTYSAWVRTGLAAVAAALGLHSLLAERMPNLLLHVSATVLLLFGALCFIAGAMRSQLNTPASRTHYVSPLHQALVVAMNMLLLLMVVAAAASIWA